MHRNLPAQPEEEGGCASGRHHANSSAIVTAAASVLIATYVKEKAANLAACLDSLGAQTLPPAQIVLVVDGPIGADQEQVIDAFATTGNAWEFRVVRLSKNGGLAAALNAGLKACTMPVIMRMDSDDICLPDRIELEYRYLDAHPEVHIVAAWAEEFDDESPAVRLRIAPTVHDAIIKALRWRNVIVHQSVAVRSDLLRSVGGYSSRFGLLEDYDLWIRLALAGAQFHIIPKVLVRARAGAGLNDRRGGFRYLVNDVRFRTHVFRAGFLTLGEFLMVTTLYSGFRLISGPMRSRLYALVRSKP